MTSQYSTTASLFLGYFGVTCSSPLALESVFQVAAFFMQDSSLGPFSLFATGPLRHSLVSGYK